MYFCILFTEDESVISESTSTLKGVEQQGTSVDQTNEEEKEDEDGEEMASTEQLDAVTHDDTAETHSTSTSSKYSIPWVKGLGFMRIYHDEELDREMSPDYPREKRDIDSILEDVEKIDNQMPIESQKVSAV